MMRFRMRRMVFFSVFLAFRALAADDFFDKTSPDSMNGFLAVTDKTYLKECGSCHFAYSPGLLPAASWVRIMSRPDKHFGETIKLDAVAGETVSRYLSDNAADKSPYFGSQILMERMDPKSPPASVMSVPRLRDKHVVIRGVIARDSSFKVRTLSNCDGCHQAAAQGDFGFPQLKIYIKGV